MPLRSNNDDDDDGGSNDGDDDDGGNSDDDGGGNNDDALDSKPCSVANWRSLDSDSSSKVHESYLYTHPLLCFLQGGGR